MPWATGSQNLARDEHIIALWNDGYSNTEIARIKSLTRNVVAGVVDRWPGEKRTGMSARVKDNQKQQRVISAKLKNAPKACARPPAVKKPVEGEPEAQGPIGAFPEHGHCLYMHGEPGVAGWRMCGHESTPVPDTGCLSWCGWHWENRVKNRNHQPETLVAKAIRVKRYKLQSTARLIHRAPARQDTHVRA